MALRTRTPNGSMWHRWDWARSDHPDEKALEAKVDHPSGGAQADKRHVTGALPGDPDQRGRGEPALGLEAGWKLGAGALAGGGANLTAGGTALRHTATARRRRE